MFFFAVFRYCKCPAGRGFRWKYVRFFGLKLYFHRFFSYVDFSTILSPRINCMSKELCIFGFLVFPNFSCGFLVFPEFLCGFAVFGTQVDPPFFVYSSWTCAELCAQSSRRCCCQCPRCQTYYQYFNDCSSWFSGGRCDLLRRHIDFCVNKLPEVEDDTKNAKGNVFQMMMAAQRNKNKLATGNRPKSTGKRRSTTWSSILFRHVTLHGRRQVRRICLWHSAS